MATSPAWAAGGHLNGNGVGYGGGNFAHGDNAQHTATGGGQLNNRHLCVVC